MSKPKPDALKNSLLPGGIEGPGNPGGGDPTGSCNICPPDHATFPEVNWRNFTPNNTAFLCGDNGFLSVGFNAVHGNSLSPLGPPPLPYRYTFNVLEPSNENRFYEGLGILAPDPTGSFGCNGIVLLPRIGLVSTTTDQSLTLSTNQGTNQGITITSAGNVGIDETNPLHKLHVNGDFRAENTAIDGLLQVTGNAQVSGYITTTTISAQNLQITQPAAQNGKVLQVVDGQSAWVNPTSVLNITGEANKIAKFTGGANGLIESDIFNAGGNVGIGTVEPTERLDVNGIIKGQRLKLLRTGTSENDGWLDLGREGKYWHITQRNNNVPDGNDDLVIMNNNNGAWSGDIFKLRPNGEAHIGSGLKVQDNGIVKIGQNVGHDYYTSSLQTGGSLRLGKNTRDTPIPGEPPPLSRLYFSGGEKVNPDPNADGENQVGLFMERQNLGINRSALRLTIGGSQAENPDIPSVSKFQIGHLDANGDYAEKMALYANGEIHARKVKVTLENFPDYVFQPNYKLRSLGETEAFIAQNGHLPEVPCAEEVEENGADLGELNKILLKKIEEMTLHLIRMEKEIEALKNQK